MASICPPSVVAKPSKDCVDLHRAFEGSFGCDGLALIQILPHRDAFQRSQIKTAYMNMYGQDLCTRLKQELHFHFEKAMLMWMQDPHERDAMILKNALAPPKLFSTAHRNQIIAEVLSTKSAQELCSIAQAYDRLYRRRLQDDIESTLSRHCTKLFSGYFDGNRDDDAGVDMDEALKEAHRLHTAVSSHQIDETALVRILTARNRWQLCSIFDAYNKTYGHDVYQDLKKRGRNGTLELVQTVVIITQCVGNAGDYYAQVLYKSMKGLIGTDNGTLIRVIVTSAEVNMESIKSAFYRKYGYALATMVSSNTTWNYQKFMLALIGAPY